MYYFLLMIANFLPCVITSKPAYSSYNFHISAVEEERRRAIEEARAASPSRVSHVIAVPSFWQKSLSFSCKMTICSVLLQSNFLVFQYTSKVYEKVRKCYMYEKIQHTIDFLFFPFVTGLKLLYIRK